jgi:hypothetical protein
MRTFQSETGQWWVAGAREEDTPRHHGRWYMILHPQDDEAGLLVLPEIRWQTRASAERTLETMSLFELRRRLDIAQRRAAAPRA